ncbi:Na+/H+ antiporter subunit D [Alkalihalobacillus sp. BA299]|uniref:Na+/H+ antiporter subunit D n=1 Tax=Alkalihalobacillus sp. BA299 TaxID=2815938 RepID=UPI001ADCC1A2|nr:Na+/H+ antiporter subunit D [Alkalihalobacillus sp. BA299]
MNNLVVLPLLIPLITGIILILFNKNVTIQKWISGFSAVILVSVNFYLLNQVYHQGIQTLKLGGWQPPFGIILVADLLAILLVLTTSVVSIACLFFAFHSLDEDREKFYFYPFFQFLITGVSGAFLTGDIFNLFVFFEVMLISSYILIVLGGSKVQLRESVKYILVNIVSSVLFVTAVAYLYAVTGTLNMADLSVRIAEVDQGPLLTVIAIFFLIVFGLKGALFPLFFWLPGSYAAPPAVVSAIFGALLTKVGIYSVFRTFSTIFYHHPEVTHQLMVVLGAITMLLGVIGAVSHWDVKKIIVYNVITAVGFIIFGIGSLSTTSYAGAIYYLLHDMTIKAALFLLIGALIAVAGTSNLKQMSGVIKYHPVLGWMFFTAALALVGVPPLSGFIGKFLLIKGGIESGHYWVVAVMLITSLLVLYSIMKIFLHGFYGKIETPKLTRTPVGLLYPCAFLLAISIGLGLGAEYVYPYVLEAAESLMDPAIYIDAVLKE